ncbi:hypothetical protein J6590_065508 [Homalodisca vitripennis]|nr:hypothetical protein J6590_065508 [Homalodisca vitripennis]
MGANCAGDNEALSMTVIEHVFGKPRPNRCQQITLFGKIGAFHEIRGSRPRPRGLTRRLQLWVLSNDPLTLVPRRLVPPSPPTTPPPRHVHPSSATLISFASDKHGSRHLRQGAGNCEEKLANRFPLSSSELRCYQRTVILG